MWNYFPSLRTQARPSWKELTESYISASRSIVSAFVILFPFLVEMEESLNFQELKNKFILSHFLVKESPWSCKCYQPSGSPTPAGLFWVKPLFLNTPHGVWRVQGFLAGFGLFDREFLKSQIFDKQKINVGTFLALTGNFWYTSIIVNLKFKFQNLKWKFKIKNHPARRDTIILHFDFWTLNLS